MNTRSSTRHQTATNGRPWLPQFRVNHGDAGPGVDAESCARWAYTLHWVAYLPELLSTFGDQAFTTHWACPGAEEHLEAHDTFGAWSAAIAFDASRVPSIAARLTNSAQVR